MRLVHFLLDELADDMFDRYTDFLVNEILPSGEVLHLRSLNAPRPSQNKRTEQIAAPEEPPQTQSNGATQEQKVEEPIETSAVSEEKENKQDEEAGQSSFEVESQSPHCRFH